VEVRLSDLGIRGSAVPVHRVPEGETYTDSKVVIRLEFGADGTPYRWDPTYGDRRLIPDALAAARRHYFNVPPHLQAQAPLRVDLVFRFQYAAVTPTLKAASPSGKRIEEFDITALQILAAPPPVFRPRSGERFSEPRVVLRVFLRENGEPYLAEPISGDPRLVPSAVEAALRHRFKLPLELRRLAPIATVLALTYKDLPG
jgi:hypothetical protein